MKAPTPTLSLSPSPSPSATQKPKPLWSIHIHSHRRPDILPSSPCTTRPPLPAAPPSPPCATLPPRPSSAAPMATTGECRLSSRPPFPRCLRLPRAAPPPRQASSAHCSGAYSGRQGEVKSAVVVGSGKHRAAPPVAPGSALLATPHTPNRSATGTI
jgi:hypothetical protein